MQQASVAVLKAIGNGTIIGWTAWPAIFTLLCIKKFIGLCSLPVGFYRGIFTAFNFFFFLSSFNRQENEKPKGHKGNENVKDHRNHNTRIK